MPRKRPHTPHLPKCARQSIECRLGVLRWEAIDIYVWGARFEVEVFLFVLTVHVHALLASGGPAIEDLVQHRRIQVR